VAGESIVDGYGESELAPGSAGQVLAPWPNRIRDGRYTFAGTAYQLPLTEPARHNAIHGLVNWVRWSVVDAAADSVTVAHSPPPTPGYPWPLSLRTTWSVRAEGLVATHEATNEGDTAAPFGLGVHPYISLSGVRVEDLVLHVPAQSRLLVDARLLPIGAARVAGGEFDFTEPRVIGAAMLDSAFGGVMPEPDGRSVVTLSTVDGTRSVSVWADGAFRWWQVFTGDTLPPERKRRSVAVEPMTCPPDAFRSGRDVVVLNPGETWRGTWGITPHVHPAAQTAGSQSP
jgi:aldose 1-epimerase